MADPVSPFYLHLSESPSIYLVSIQLIAQNYTVCISSNALQKPSHGLNYKEL